MQTSKIITQQNLSIASTVASPAPELVQPVEERDLITKNQLCGGSTCESLSNASPDSLLSKIRKDLSPTGLEQCLPLSEWRGIHGTIRSSYRQRNLERRTDAPDSLSLPTPTTYPKSSGRGGAAGQNKLEMTLKRLLPTPTARDGNGAPSEKYQSASLPRTVQGYLLKAEQMSPAVPGWMMGFPAGWVELVLMDGGSRTRRRSAQGLQRRPLTGVALLVAMGYRLHQLKQCSLSCESDTLPTSLQPTEADAGKEVYVDAVTKRGVFKGGIYKAMVAGTEITFGVVKFPDCHSASVFPIEEIELVPQEKSTKNTTGDVMLTQLTQATVAVGDVLVSRSGKITGTVTRVMKRFVEIDGAKKLTWDDFHILHYTKQKPIAEAVRSENGEITEAPVTEVAGISDSDEAEKLVHKINELDRAYIFEVGGCLLRLKEVWQPSNEHPDFDSFCLAKLGKRYSSTHRNDLINAAKLQPILSETATAVLSNSLNATKPLYSMMHKGVDSEKIAEVVEEAAATGNVTRESVEAIATAKGYLPAKRQAKKQQAESATQEQGRSLGLSGSGSQQLPSIESNADIPLAITKPLATCVTANEVMDALTASPKSAWDEFTSLDWQERFRLRNLCPDISTRFRTLESEQMSVGAMLTHLELADKDSKIEWLEARVMELEAKLQKPVSTRTDEWYTPPEFIEMARTVMGSIDLDPASNELAQSWIQAKKYFTKDDEGLMIASWWKEGDAPINVWCNPPYGRTVELWLETVVDGFLDGNIKSAILLLNRTGAAWYKARTKEVNAICEVHKRIAFIDENGQRQSSPRYYNDFLYLGKDVEKFIEVFSAIGDVRVMEQPSEQKAA